MSRRALVAGAIAGAFAAFVGLAIVAHRVPYFAWDPAITRQVQGFGAAWFELLLRPLNALGFPPVVAIVDGILVLALVAVGARTEAAGATFTAVGSTILLHLTKALVNRPRPTADLVHVAHHLPGSGFPAGHVLNFTAFAGFLCYVAWVRLAPSLRRTAVVVALAAMIVLMGVARIDAGEHWPSDVLGGYLIGIVWLSVTIAFYRWEWRRWPRAQ